MTMSSTAPLVPQGFVRRPSGVRLDTELSAALRRLDSVRDRRLVARHLGWDGGLPCSLKEAGAGFQVTRERARQVYAVALPVLRGFDDVPALTAALLFVRKHQHEQASSVEQDLVRRGFTGKSIRLEGILKAAEIFGCTPGFELHEVGGVRFVGAVSQVANAVLQLAASASVHGGAARVSDLCRQLSKGRRSAVDARLARQILETRSDLIWLDKSREWFWLAAVPRNRLVTRIQKVLAAHHRVRLSLLHEAISRDHKPLKIPESVLQAFCHRLFWCRVDGKHVEARVAPRVEKVLAGAEAIIYEILRDQGGAAPLPKLQSLCRERGVRKANLWRVLSFSPLLRRFNPQVYGLVGAEAAARRLPKTPQRRG